jgi:protein TonB
MADERTTSPWRVPLAVLIGRQVLWTGWFLSTTLSAAVHVVLIGFLAWQTAKPLYYDANRTPGDGSDGRGGGGGGGGNRTVAVVPVFMRAFVPPPAPPPMETPALTVPVAVQPLPEPRQDTTPPTPVPSAETPTGQPAAGPGLGEGQGTGVGPGQGSGTGGGIGGGVGTGIGNDSGPGGGGGNIYPPQLQGLLLPPPGVPRSLRGTRVTVTFFVSVRGAVDRVQVEPEIQDRGYRNEFLERMRRYTFTPAYTREGRAVPAQFAVIVTL